MFDVISAVGGGENVLTLVLGALATGAGSMLVRPKALLGFLVAVTAPFPGTRTHRRYLEAFAVAHGVGLPPGKKQRGK
jgi:hypothetical protein